MAVQAQMTIIRNVFCENKKKLCITDIRLEITLSIEDNVIFEDDARDKQRVE